MIYLDGDMGLTNVGYAGDDGVIYTPEVHASSINGRTAIELGTDGDSEIIFPSGTLDLSGDFLISTFAYSPSSGNDGSYNFIFSTDWGHNAPNLDLYAHHSGQVRL